MRASGVSSGSAGPTVSPNQEAGGKSPEAAADSEKISKSSVECGVCEDGGTLGPKVLKHRYRPSAREVEEHNATHVPFRNWCPFCVAGKAKNNPHFRREEGRSGDIPVVSMDYTYM